MEFFGLTVYLLAISSSFAAGGELMKVGYNGWGQVVLFLTGVLVWMCYMSGQPKENNLKTSLYV